MHRASCVQCTLTRSLLTSPHRRGEEEEGERGRARSTQRKKQGRVQEFVSSCHVLSFSETPTGGGQTCVGLGPVRRGPAPTLPACLLPAPVLSAVHSTHPSVDSFIFPELRKCWPGHNRVTRLMALATRPRFQRAQTPIPECLLIVDV